jgi:hypothetical protein
MACVRGTWDTSSSVKRASAAHSAQAWNTSAVLEQLGSRYLLDKGEQEPKST